VDNVLAVFEAPEASLAQLPSPQRGLVLVAVETEKPGNLGALLRTADAVGVDAVLVVDPVCDPWNPQVARNSLGALFRVPLAVCSASEARTWLQEHGLMLVLGHLEATQEYTQATLSGPVAVVVGPEDRGLAPDWNQKDALRVKIPMRGLVDSLNVSVSAAVLLYEVDRQQQASKS
jgi:TrmH family RNA methyltransferase